MSLLSVRHCTKTYAGVPALSAASLDIAAGEIHALMGENGAGKSTMIRVLAGVETADDVAISVNGRPVTIDSPAEAYGAGLRFIHQELNVVPTISVAENIFLGRPLPSRLGTLVDWKRLAAEARRALSRLGIDHIDPRRQMARLGHGDQMLVRISSAFIDSGDASAHLYVMDEPTASLTGAESERLFEVLRELRRAGRSVLYVSHRLDEVMHLCDRVTVLRGGKVISSRAVAETTREEIVHDMIGRPVEEAYPEASASSGEGTALSVESLSGHGLDAVSFEVGRGEIVGLAGLAGAGQSEVLRLLMGADRASAGRVVSAHGGPQPPVNPANAWKRRFAYVPRERRSEGLVLTRPIAENMSLPHLGKFLSARMFLARGRERAFARRSGEDVGLAARGPDQLCYQLSGGNQQEVVFARALAEDPDILLLDEPTRGVDVGARFDIYQLVRAASAAGTGVVIASSDFPELIGLCDRILIMRDGRLAETLTTDGLTEERLLLHCYGGQGAPSGNDGARVGDLGS